MGDLKTAAPATSHEAASPWSNLLAAAPALLLVPMLLTTVTGLLAPAPWGVPEELRAPVLFACAVVWVVLPFAVGVWQRRWWWPLLCLATVLLSALLLADGGQAVVGGYGDYGYGAPPVTVAVLRPALLLGTLATLIGAAGVALAPVLHRLDLRVLYAASAGGLVTGIVPVVIGLLVLQATSGESLGAGLVVVVSFVTLTVFAIYGPYQQGNGSGRGDGNSRASGCWLVWCYRCVSSSRGGGRTWMRSPISPGSTISNSSLRCMAAASC